jgi:uncharacterized protein
MRTDQGLIDFLSDPRNYPEHPCNINHRETHISHVFVGDDVVYKIKKPVDFGFLDFTALEKRRYFCEQEVFLNGRLAPGIYLGVAAIHEKDGVYSFRQKGGSRVSEYAVKMKRMPERNCLSSTISDGGLPDGRLEDIGQLIGHFHEAAPIHRNDHYGTLEIIRTNSEENFRQIASYRDRTIKSDVYSRLVAYTREFLDAHGSLMDARKKEGWVREGHGDLHSQHVYLVNPPIILDCLEFSKRFRIIDVLDDMAFLLMDIEYHGRFDMSSMLRKAYLSVLPDAASADLLLFYRIYRAVVRGKVEGFSSTEDSDPDGGHLAALKAENYYHLAVHYIEDGDHPFNPIVLMGPSGSGKSTIASQLAERWLVISSDEVRKAMMGIPAERHLYVDYAAGIYGPEVTERVYEAIVDRAIAEARQGKRVVIDATYLRSSDRLHLYTSCRNAGLNPLFLFCVTEVEILRERILARKAAGENVSDAHLAVLEEQLRTLEEPAELPSFRVMKLNTAGNSAETVGRTLAVIAQN